MARVIGAFDKSSNYEVSIRKPIDARMLVPSYADLTNSSNWLNKDNKSTAYNGMLVAVANASDLEHSGVYYFFDTSYSALKGGDVTLESNWHKIAEISDLDSLSERIAAIEGIEAGVTDEELSAAVDALRQEILSKGYITDVSNKADITHTHSISDITDYEAPDLSDYYKKTETYSATEIDAKLVALDFDSYAKATELTDIRNDIDSNTTRIDELSNSLTSVSNVVDSNTKEIDAIDERISELSSRVDAIPDVEQFVDTTELNNTLEEYVTDEELASKSYATESFVTTKIAEAKLENSDIDLSGYYTKTEAEDKFIDTDELDVRVQEIENAIPDVSGFTTMEMVEAKGYITEIPENYVTDEELNSKGFLTEHQDLSEYAKKEDLPDTSNFITEVPAEYITEDELNQKGFITEHQSLDGYAKLEDIPTDYIKEIPSEYITEDELSQRGYLTEHQDISGLATKAELDGYATDEELSEKADKATTLAGYGITDTYTATQIDQKLTELATGGSINLDGYVSEDEWNTRVTDLATKADVEEAKKVYYEEF